MQDRFKFRVFDKKENKIIDFNDFKKGDIEFNFNPDTQEIWIEYDKSRYIIIQCTGLRDKNGTLIYEGDILADAKHKYVVEWSLSDGYFIRKPWICELFCYRIDKETTRNTKIIGNIYENAALLRKYGAFMSGA
mgnify:CR=1 FL=1